MNRELCRKLIQQFDYEKSTKLGFASKHIQEWLDSLDLSSDLLNLMKWDWPQEDCRIGHDCLLSSESIYNNEAKARFLHYRLMNIGSASDGDWIAIDFSTDQCISGLILHDQWNPWDDDQVDPRDFFQPVAQSFDAFLADCLRTTCEIRAKHERAKAAATERGPLAFTSFHAFEEKCEIASVPIPDGYQQKTASHARCTVWLVPKTSEGGMVVSLFSLLHKRVDDAKEGRFGFRDFQAGKRLWRLAMPGPNDASLDSFMAILVLKEVAVAAYASNLYWSEDDLRIFLSDVKLRDD